MAEIGFGAMARSGWGRGSLMANQWHPNSEGGRMFALAIMSAMGATAEDIARTGDAQDAAMFAALTAASDALHPRFIQAQAIQPEAEVALLVSSFTTNTVQALAATGDLVASIAVSHHPMGLAWDPTRQVAYVACEGSGLLEVIQLPDLILLDPIEVGDIYPVAVVLQPDGQTLWTGNYFGSSIPAGEAVFFIHSESATIRHGLKVGGNPDTFYEDEAGDLFVVDAAFAHVLTGGTCRGQTLWQ